MVYVTVIYNSRNYKRPIAAGESRGAHRIYNSRNYKRPIAEENDKAYLYKSTIVEIIKGL